LNDETEQRKCFPSYIHVLQPDQGQHVALDEWFGVAGQIRKDLNRTEKLLTLHIKDQLTNPNTGLETKLQKSIKASIDHGLKATHNEVTIEIGKLAKDIQSTKDILMKEIRKGLKDAQGEVWLGQMEQSQQVIRERVLRSRPIVRTTRVVAVD
jgi:hypothetical protein